ncbi:MAG: CoA-binding protein, partial [Acidobacteria bacterium]|nr:CoA-binding protein [Acidobacteriota bacterium]NIQ85062.1 CoA-binding protein [Acidobacteriota bacterium]
SNYEDFWKHDTFAVVGHSTKRAYPILTYRGLKDLGKTVIPVDPSTPEIEGDHAYTDLAHLPRRADAIVIEVPREETREW